MTRTKLADRKLPDYTRGEEISNMVTHIVGGAFGFAALLFCLYFSIVRGGALRIFGAAVYGLSLIALYSVSSVYHGLYPSLGKKVMQVIDHCMIYFLIAGTYTPILLGPMMDTNPTLAWAMFALVWGISAVAVTFTAIDHNKFKVLSMACYLGIGWLAVFALKATIAAVTFNGFMYLLAGGISYTIGAVLYGVGKYMKIRYVHSVFHVFVLAGTVLHFVPVLRCFIW